MVLFSILSLYIITHVHSISLETFSIFLANFEFCRLSQLLARFLCKEYTATTLPQYISPAKPYFLSPDIAIIPYAAFAIGTVNSFSQKRLCQNEYLRRKARRGGCQAPPSCLTAYATLTLLIPTRQWSGISYIDTALIPTPFPIRTTIWHKPASVPICHPGKCRQRGCVSGSHGSCAR